MHAQSIQEIIGTALTDATFCKALLNGSRQRILQSFQLDGDEFEALMAIRADSLEQFAGQAHEFLLKTEALHEFKPLPPVRWRPIRREP
jgi:hypothetical protein